MKDLDLSYAAGLIDGEGSFCLSKDRKTSKFRHPTVQLSSTSYELLEFMKSLFGGCICSHKTYKPNHKKHWSWKVADTRAVEVSQILLPYLREKTKIYRAWMIGTIYPKVTIRNGKYSELDLTKKLLFESEFFHPSIPWKKYFFRNL